MVKVASLSQGAGSSQLTDANSQVVYGASSEPVRAFFMEGSNVKDQVPIDERLGQKRKIMVPLKVPFSVEGQIIFIKDSPIVEGILVLSTPYHGLDVL